MKTGFIIKVFDGRKEKFVAETENKKTLTGDARKAKIYDTYEQAGSLIPALYVADAVCDIFHLGFIREETMMSIVKVSYI